MIWTYHLYDMLPQMTSREGLTCKSLKCDHLTLDFSLINVVSLTVYDFRGWEEKKTSRSTMVV